MVDKPTSRESGESESSAEEKPQMTKAKGPAFQKRQPSPAEAIAPATAALSFDDKPPVSSEIGLPPGTTVQFSPQGHSQLDFGDPRFWTLVSRVDGLETKAHQVSTVGCFVVISRNGSDSVAPYFLPGVKIVEEKDRDGNVSRKFHHV